MSELAVPGGNRRKARIQCLAALHPSDRGHAIGDKKEQHVFQVLRIVDAGHVVVHLRQARERRVKAQNITCCSIVPLLLYCADDLFKIGLAVRSLLNE